MRHAELDATPSYEQPSAATVGAIIADACTQVTSRVVQDEAVLDLEDRVAVIRTIVEDATTFVGRISGDDTIADREGGVVVPNATAIGPHDSQADNNNHLFRADFKHVAGEVPVHHETNGPRPGDSEVLIYPQLSAPQQNPP